MALTRSGSSKEASDGLRMNPLPIPHLKVHQPVVFQLILGHHDQPLGLTQHKLPLLGS